MCAVNTAERMKNMSEQMNTREQVKRNAEVIERVQNLRAMERLVVNMGGKSAYIAWIKAMPDDVELQSIGSVGQESLKVIAENEQSYSAVVKAFATSMGPILIGMAEV